MHPELSKELVNLQLEEAQRMPSLFGADVQLEDFEYPKFFVRFTNATGRVRLLQFDCVNYDYQAMEIEPVHPDNRCALDRSDWLRRSGGEFPVHPRRQMPFLCVEAVRSFYTYPGHDPLTTNQPWEMHRAQFRVADVLRRIAQNFRNGTWT